MKSKYKNKLLQMVADIANDNLGSYDIQKLVGKKHMYRIRIGEVRCIFLRTATGNKIVQIDSRGDVYKGL